MTTSTAALTQGLIAHKPASILTMFIVVWVWVVVAPKAASGEDIYVSYGASSSSADGSAKDPFPLVMDAVDHVGANEPGSTIWIGPGGYGTERDAPPLTIDTPSILRPIGGSVQIGGGLIGPDCHSPPINATGSPIGGRDGYQNTIGPDSADFIVSTKDELLEALDRAGAGDVVYVADDAEIKLTKTDMDDEGGVTLNKGVTLASGRGTNDSPGALIFTDDHGTWPGLFVAADDVRVTGIRLRGPYPHIGDNETKPADSAGIASLCVRQCHPLPNPLDCPWGCEAVCRAECETRECYNGCYGQCYHCCCPCEHSGLEVDNCEISEWGHAGVKLFNSRQAHIHHNYIHHNRVWGTGYGVSLVGTSNGVVVEANLFERNSHDIAGTGEPEQSYEAGYNVSLPGCNSHSFDMHAWGQDWCFPDDFFPCQAAGGDKIVIHHNTFMCTTGYRTYAVHVRGRPQTGTWVEHNWFQHFNQEDAIHQRDQHHAPADDNLYVNGNCRNLLPLVEVTVENGTSEDLHAYFIASASQSSLPNCPADEEEPSPFGYFDSIGPGEETTWKVTLGWHVFVRYQTSTERDGCNPEHNRWERKFQAILPASFVIE